MGGFSAASGQAQAVAGVLRASHGWRLVLGVVVAYEAVCVEEELLSRGFDRLLDRHPIWPRVAVLTVAFHLINWLPDRCDPVAALFWLTRVGGRSERLTAWGKRALSRRRAARKSSA